MMRPVHSSPLNGCSEAKIVSISCTVAKSKSDRRWSMVVRHRKLINQLHRHRGAAPKSVAERSHTTLPTLLAQGIEQSNDDARPRCANGVPKRNAAAIDIHPVGAEAEALLKEHIVEGKRFIILKEVKVRHLHP